MNHTFYVGYALDEVLRQAADVLGVSESNLATHPDFLLVGMSGEKKELGVEDIKPILEKAYLDPVTATKNVVVIDHAERLSVIAQNKLLLSLESSPYLLVLGCCSSDNALLPTVVSRCRILRKGRTSADGFFEAVASELSPSEAEMMYFASNGNLATYTDVLSKWKDEFMAMWEAADMKSFLSALHLLKEKDPLSISASKEGIYAGIRFLQYFALRKDGDSVVDGRSELLTELAEAERFCQNKLYTKDDFFLCVVQVCEVFF